MTTEQGWWLTLALGAVVVGVVALLLALIHASARQIRDALVEVWVVGPDIADNTAALDTLRRINLAAGDILAAAQRVAGSATRILEHAHGCAGCPRCVVGWGGR